MNVFVGWSQRNTLHVHSDRNVLTFVGTSVHHLVFHQSLGLGLCGHSCSKCLLSHQSDLHTLDFYFNQMEVNSPNNDVPQMVKGLVVLEVDVEAVLDSHLHLHGYYLSGSFDLLIRQQHGEIDLFNHIELSSHHNSNKISNSSSNAVESFVLLFEVGKLELIRFIF